MDEHGETRRDEESRQSPDTGLEASSSSPRRPRLTSSKDRTQSAASGSRSPRPRNAISDYYDSQTFAYSHEPARGSYSDAAPAGPAPRRSESDRGPSMKTYRDEEQQQQRDGPSQQGQASESDFPSLSALSNIPSMSGIGLATNALPSSYTGTKAPSLDAGMYSTSPPVTYINTAGSGGSSHLSRVGAGAATSSTTNTSAAGHRSRSRLPSRNSEGGSADFSHDGSGSHGSRRRQSSQERPRTGISSGTSNSNSSTWSFFRSSSSAQLAPRAHMHMPDPFSAISEKAEPLLSPIAGRSGVSTPMAYDGNVTPVIQPSGLNEELRRRIAGLRTEGSSRSRTRINYSCSFVLSEGNTGQPGTPTGSFMSAKRRGRKGSMSGFSSPDNQPRRRAEGLVAMAARSTNTSESSKVVVAGRSLLKILSLSRPRSGSDSGDESQDGGSGWSAGNATDSSRGADKRRRGVQVEEDVDLQGGMLYSGAKNSKAALINDVGWGYDYTADKIMTGNSNGTVALYDLGKGGSKLERLKTHHQSGRAINVVSFAGPSGQGTLLASGCQDGDIKLSDVRHASIITLATPLDPIRALCFAPRHNSTADPFQLISAYESGNIARWDLRMPKNAVERLMAHHGGVLSIDWKGATDATQILGDSSSEDSKAGSSYGWGWLATAGMDGTVKIWDMSSPSHTPQVVHTLHVGRASHFVRWSADPSRPCDVVVAPSGVGSGVGTLDDSWQPDVEIWDVRREYLPKQTFWLGGSPVSVLSPSSNPDVLWCLNRKTSAFQQVDIQQEAISPIDYVPKVTAAWSADGSLAFAIGSNRCSSEDSAHVLPNPADRAAAAVQTTGLVAGLDPTFDVHAFRYLADQYQFKTDEHLSFPELCRGNAEVRGHRMLVEAALIMPVQTAMEVDRYDTAKIWRLIGQWIETSPPESSATPAPQEAISEGPPILPDHHKTPAITRNRAKSRTSPSNALQHLHLAEGHASHQSSPLVTSHVISEADLLQKPAPLSLPPPKLRQPEKKDSNNIDLVGSDTSAGSSIPDSLAVEEQGTLGSSSDEIEVPGSAQLTARRFSDDRMSEINDGLAASLPSHLVMKRRPTLSSIAQQVSAGSSRTVTRSSSSANNTQAGESLTASRSMTRHLGKTLPETNVLPSGRGGRALSNNSSESAKDTSRPIAQWSMRKEPAESSASEASGDSDIDDDEHELTAESLRARGVRQFKIHKQRAQARQSRSKSRRRGKGSAEENPRRTVSGRQSRSVSASRRAQRSMSKIRAEALHDSVKKMQNEVRQMLSDKFGEHLHQILQDLADSGDVQTSATIACAVRDKIDVNSQFLARITTAYLSLLRRLDCHLTGAKVTKDSTVETIKSQSQDNTTIRTACGTCEKAIHHAPFSKCRKCSAETATCSICHTVGLSLWIFCPTCGHGAHEECLYAYASDISRSALSGLHGSDKLFSGLPTPTTVPSSPHVALDSPGSVHWLFPSEQALFTPVSALPSRLNSRAASPDIPHLDQNALESRAVLLSQCPSGCGHSCLLALPLSELPEQSWVF